MEEKIQWLFDRAKIQDVFISYATNVDKCDWASLKSIFTDDIERDLSSFTGSPPEKIKSAQHVNECRSTLPGFDSTQHFLLNNDIAIDGNQATAVVYMTADHTIVEDSVQKQFTICGIYTFQLVRNDSDWKICGLTLNVLSTQGDQSLFEVAGKRVATMDQTQLSKLR